jgi:hypothetical protein
MCRPAVPGEMCKAWAIWRLVQPAAISSATCRSRGVRSPSDFGRSRFLARQGRQAFGRHRRPRLEYAQAGAEGSLGSGSPTERHAVHRSGASQDTWRQPP